MHATRTANGDKTAWSENEDRILRENCKKYCKAADFLDCFNIVLILSF
jgi:hypothetical protein